MDLKDIINGTCRKAISDEQGNSIPETYLKKTGDSKDNTASFTSADSLTPAAWADVPVLATGEKHSSILNKISTMFRNIRWLYKMLGTTNIASIGGGTLTGAISKLNTDLQYKDISKEIIILKEGTSFDSAYVKNGIVWITGRAPAGTTEMVTQIAKISAPYAPRTDMRGFPSCNATTEDIGKMSSICMRSSGVIDIFFKEPLVYAEIFAIIYPLK